MGQTIVVQKWEESERGWGCRPDGWTMHLTMEARDAYVVLYAKRQDAQFKSQGGHGVPDEYTRPSGTPYPMDVDEETYNKIAAAEDKTIWGPGNMPPTGQQGPNGWRDVPKVN